MPAATTENVAVAGAVTVAPTGCVVIDGAAGAAVTVSVAADEVTEPCELDTETSYLVPDSATVVAGVV